MPHGTLPFCLIPISFNIILNVPQLYVSLIHQGYNKRNYFDVHCEDFQNLNQLIINLVIKINDEYSLFFGLSCNYFDSKNVKAFIE